MVSSIPLPIPIEGQLESLHEALRSEMPAITRIAVALYDRKTDLLKTFANSTDGGSPLNRYDARLADVPSLAALAKSGADRVVADLTVFDNSETEHSKALRGRWASSYTRPVFEQGKLRGFLFFDASEKGYFTPGVVKRLGVYAEFVSLMLANSLFPARMLKSVVHVAAEVTHTRDPETGAHLDRMSRYARIIAQALADDEGLSDAFIEFLFMFAPLHDIGKVAIPDSVLLKPGRLSPEEFEVMKSHVTRGGEMIDRVLEDLGVESLPYVSVLRAVIMYHHEAWDGGGYPHGLAGGAIPIEARIVTVADVFDALTSARPYKVAWEPAVAFEYLSEHAGTLFDPQCVRALRAAEAEVLAVRDRFTDAPDAVVLREGYTPEL